MFFAKKEKSCLFKLLAVFAIFVVLTTGLVYKFYIAEKSPITDFVYSRDAEGILKIFDKDWYWLVASSREEYSPDFMLKNKTHNQDPENFGKLVIKVFRDNNKLAGFAAYFKINFYTGRLLYVAVDGDFRGKGYGEKLARAAIKDLFAMGCSIVLLDTRLDNTRARALYKKLGFEETVEGEFVRYTMYKK